MKNDDARTSLGADEVAGMFGNVKLGDDGKPSEGAKPTNQVEDETQLSDGNGKVDETPGEAKPKVRYPDLAHIFLLSGSSLSD